MTPSPWRSQKFAGSRLCHNRKVLKNKTFLSGKSRFRAAGKRGKMERGGKMICPLQGMIIQEGAVQAAAVKCQEGACAWYVKMPLSYHGEKVEPCCAAVALVESLVRLQITLDGIKTDLESKAG
jgi:hypothetical protein